MTYKKIACDISRCFAPGQAYVALSRCSSMDGLYLLSKAYGTGIHINKTIVDFYRKQSTGATISEYYPRSVKKRANPFKNDPPNGHQPWSKEEDDELLEQYKSGLKIKEIAKLHQRTNGAIRARLKKRGFYIQ